jgi:DMSO/TMAO reductase YedYZ molybdopterin-dependent catalytic subunit
MNTPDMSRRELLRQGGTAVVGLTLLQSPWVARAFPRQPGEEVLPWVEQPQAPTSDFNLLNWQELDSWITPNQKFFRVVHYHKPLGPALDENDWRLEVTGLVKRPLIFTLRDLKARPRQEAIFTLECAGNRPQLFHGAVGTATWAGTPLAPILREAGVTDKGIEVVFVGSDTGEEEVRGIKMPQNFARSLSLADAINPHHLLCYEMNGEPLPQPNGSPAADRAGLVWHRQCQMAAAHRSAGHPLYGPLHGARVRDPAGRAAPRRNGLGGDLRRSGLAHVGARQSHP